MKDNLFEILMGLFEQTLTKLKEQYVKSQTDNQETNNDQAENYIAFVQSQQKTSMRVLNDEELYRLTGASYQLIARMVAWEVVHPDVIELILNRLLLSETNFISLKETQLAIRNVLADSLNHEQLAFLDLIMNQNTEGSSLH